MYPLEIRRNRDAAKPLLIMTCRPPRAACSLTAPTVNVCAHSKGERAVQRVRTPPTTQGGCEQQLHTGNRPRTAGIHIFVTTGAKPRPR